MTEQEKLWWSNFREANRPYLENDEYKSICELYSREFNKELFYPCKCNPSKIQNMIDELNAKFDKL